MNEIDTNAVNERIDSFVTQQDVLSPAQAETFLVDILRPLFEADGYTLEHTGGIGDNGADYTARRGPSGSPDSMTTIVEYKHYRSDRMVGVESARSLLGAAMLQRCERAILLANSRFSNAAQEILLRDLPIEFQLMNIESLRAWTQRLKRSKEKDLSSVTLAVETLSRTLSHLIARNPRVLDELEWRDMERVLAEVFDEFGFAVELTPPSKDGGKDIVLRCFVSGKDMKYLVEVKHWRSGQGVGGKLLKEFVHVVANEQADGGLFLSTYGYASNAIEALTNLERRRIQMGAEAKVVALCQMYVRSESGVWSPPALLPELLFKDDMKL